MQKKESQTFFLQDNMLFVFAEMPGWLLPEQTNYDFQRHPKGEDG